MRPNQRMHLTWPSRYATRSVKRVMRHVRSQIRIFGLVTLWEGNPPETGVLSVKLYRRRLPKAGR
jgi:hypothetical protein